MDTPFGLGFGMAQAAPQIGQALVNQPIRQTQMKGLQLQQQNEALRNQQLGRAIEKERGYESAMLAQGEQGQGESPYDQPIANMKARYQALRDKGLGSEAAQMEGELIKLNTQQRAHYAGLAAQRASAGQFPQAVDAAKKAGIGITAIEQGDYQVDPSTNRAVKTYKITDDSGATSTVTDEDLWRLAQDPATAVKTHDAHFMALQNLGLKQTAEQRKQAESQSRINERQAKLERWPQELAIRKGNLQANLQKAGALSSMAGTQAKRLALDPKAQTYGWLTQVMGYDPAEASQTIGDIQRSSELGLTPEAAATRQAMDYLKANMIEDPDGSKFKKAYDNFLEVAKTHPAYAPKTRVEVAPKAGAKQPPKASPAEGQRRYGQMGGKTGWQVYRGGKWDWE